MRSDTQKRPTNFAIVGAGFIFDRHWAAIEHVGGRLLAVADTDPDKKNKLDSGVQFYDSFDELRKSGRYEDIDTVVVCTPNWTHSTISLAALEDGKNVLCEKPAVISSEELETLKRAEEQSEGKLFFVHQLRMANELHFLKKKIEREQIMGVEVSLRMHRGDFYWDGWKGKDAESGGILFNIGVHYLDLLVWFFGEPEDYEVITLTDKKAKLIIEFEKTKAAFELDLTVDKANQSRVIRFGDQRLNLTRILESLHNKVYEQLVELKGIGVDDVAPTIHLCEELTNSKRD